MLSGIEKKNEESPTNDFCLRSHFFVEKFNAFVLIS